MVCRRRGSLLRILSDSLSHCDSPYWSYERIIDNLDKNVKDKIEKIVKIVLSVYFVRTCKVANYHIDYGYVTN